MSGIMDVLQGNIKGPPRLVYTYQVPKGIENPFRSVGVIELLASEHMLMSRMMSPDSSPEEQMQSLVKACIYEIDGHKAHKATAEFEIMWEKVHPKVRSMLKKVVTQLHVPEPKEEEDFFSSRSVRTEG